MMKAVLFTAAMVLLTLTVSFSFAVRKAQGQVDDSVATDATFVAPSVFQAAGTSGNSIQSSVGEFRLAIGGNNNNNDGPHNDGGRREINWDGGNPANQTTTISPNPFAGFQTTRGALFTTPDGTGFVQAPPSGLASASVFNNPSYATIFAAFSPSRLFSPIGSNVTDVDFFVPGGGNVRATTRAFAAVFTDVDQPDGSGPGEKRGNRKSSTLIEFFGVNGELLFSSFVPASPGDHSLSFFGVVFPDARIAHVRITSGNAVPGADDTAKTDVVMMDDFIYSEPHAIQ